MVGSSYSIRNIRLRHDQLSEENRLKEGLATTRACPIYTEWMIAGVRRKACISLKPMWCYRLVPVSQQASKPVFCTFVSYSCCISTTSCERHNQRGKGTVLHFPYSQFVGPDLRSLMFPVCTGKALLTIGGASGLKTRTSKKVLSRRPPQKPFAAMSSLAPSSIIAEAPLRVSPESGCKVGSMQTSLKTSDNQPPTVSRTSLCRMEGKPPLGQEGLVW